MLPNTIYLAEEFLIENANNIDAIANVVSATIKNSILTNNFARDTGGGIFTGSS